MTEKLFTGTLNRNQKKKKKTIEKKWGKIEGVRGGCRGCRVDVNGGNTLALIFQKSWFITARFHSIHLRAYFSQVNVTIALIVFYWQPSYQI